MVCFEEHSCCMVYFMFCFRQFVGSSLTMYATQDIKEGAPLFLSLKDAQNEAHLLAETPVLILFWCFFGAAAVSFPTVCRLFPGHVRYQGHREGAPLFLTLKDAQNEAHLLANTPVFMLFWCGCGATMCSLRAPPWLCLPLKTSKRVRPCS